MHCDICRTILLSRAATKDDPYIYSECGLDTVSLIGIAVHSCSICVLTVPVIPRMAELHRVIARGLLEKPERLEGTEIRYLRKFAGKSSKQFAELLRIDPSTLSRAEADTKPLGPPTDKLVRMIASATTDVKETKSVALQLPAGKSHPGRWRRVLEPSSHGWKQASGQ
jgi:DNA-binding transcriptional regulator YiaG